MPLPLSEIFRPGEGYSKSLKTYRWAFKEGNKQGYTRIFPTRKQELVRRGDWNFPQTSQGIVYGVLGGRGSEGEYEGKESPFVIIHRANLSKKW